VRPESSAAIDPRKRSSDGAGVSWQRKRKKTLAAADVDRRGSIVIVVVVVVVVRCVKLQSHENPSDSMAVASIQTVQKERRKEESSGLKKL
jgi:hypothetical protein